MEIPSKFLLNYGRRKYRESLTTENPKHSVQVSARPMRNPSPVIDASQLGPVFIRNRLSMGCCLNGTGVCDLPISYISKGLQPPKMPARPRPE